MTKTAAPTAVTVYFVGRFEDATKLEAAARANGWTPDSDTGWGDHVELLDDDFLTVRRFSAQDEAVAWVAEQVRKRRTAFGVGDVLERHTIPRPCRYCVCGGVQTARRHIVGENGIEESHDDDSESRC